MQVGLQQVHKPHARSCLCLKSVNVIMARLIQLVDLFSHASPQVNTFNCLRCACLHFLYQIAFFMFQPAIIKVNQQVLMLVESWPYQLKNPICGMSGEFALLCVSQGR